MNSSFSPHFSWLETNSSGVGGPPCMIVTASPTFATAQFVPWMYCSYLQNLLTGGDMSSHCFKYNQYPGHSHAPSPGLSGKQFGHQCIKTMLVSQGSQKIAKWERISHPKHLG